MEEYLPKCQIFEKSSYSTNRILNNTLQIALTVHMDGETVGEGRITKSFTNKTETEKGDIGAKNSKSGNYSDMNNSKDIGSTNSTDDYHRNSTAEEHTNDKSTNSTKANDDGKSDNSTHVVHMTDNSSNSTESDRNHNALSHKQNNSSNSQVNQPSIIILIQKENNESFRIDNQTKSTTDKNFYITKTTEIKLKISNGNSTALNTTVKDNAANLGNTSDNVTILTSTENSKTNKTAPKPGKNMDYLMLPNHNENSQKEKQQGQGKSTSPALLAVNSSKEIAEKATVNRTQEERQISKVNGTHKEKSNQENSIRGNSTQGFSNQGNSNQGNSNPASRHQVEKTSFQGVLGLQDDSGTGAEMFPILSNRSFGDVDVQNEGMNVKDSGKSGTLF